MRSKAGFSFVAKRLSLTGISYKELQRFELEVQVCAKLRHPNIVHYLATRVSKHAIQGDMLLICLEYAAGGTLAKRIDEHHERHEPFPAAQAAMWVAQVASAVSYMHSQRVMHRDLSAQNVFLSRAGDVKVCGGTTPRRARRSPSLPVATRRCSSLLVAARRCSSLLATRVPRASFHS